MHTLETVKHQQVKYQELSNKLNRKAIALRRKNEDKEAERVELVMREYMFKSAALLWVINEDAPIFPSLQVMESLQS